MHNCPKFKGTIEYQNFIEGWIKPVELLWLYSTAKEMDSIVEVGSWRGRSTHALLSGCRGTVWAVDHFKGSKEHLEYKDLTFSEEEKEGLYKDFLKNVGFFKNLKVLKMRSLDAAEKFKNNSVDMVFIDGGHGYEEVKQDIKAWYPKARKIICGHDFDWQTVYDAVDESFDKIFILEGLWVNFKNNECIKKRI